MSNRRIFETCPELRHHLSLNSTGDQIVSSHPCGKELRVIHESVVMSDTESDELGRPLPTDQLYQILACGHHRIITATNWYCRPSQNRHKLFEKLIAFQQQDVCRIEESNFNCYLQLEMGMGKTPVALSALRENWEQLTPCLIICEAGDIYRWQKETVKWTDLASYRNDPAVAFKRMPVVMTGGLKGTNAITDVTITSWTALKDEKFRKMIQKQGFKCIIADEAHMFKNEESSRTNGFIELCKFVPHKILLSATWLENRLGEAFVPLNILDPTFFPSRSALEAYCIQDQKGKPYALHPGFRDYFMRRISKYVFRRTKESVKLPMPSLSSYSKGNRPPIWIDIAREKTNKEMLGEYNELLDKLEEELSASRIEYGQIIGIMSQLRHLTGKMKVLSSAELIALKLMALNDPKNNKLCIGVHHKSVMDWLAQILRALGFSVLTMSSESAEEKDAIEAKFKLPENRVLIASILGAGKGRNLQFCQNAIILERQWNPSKERQFEQRFHRIKTDPVTDKVITEFGASDEVVIDYIMARGTFDEYFDEMVKMKEIIVDSGDLSVDKDDLPPTSVIMELANRIVATRVKYVGA